MAKTLNNFGKYLIIFSGFILSLFVIYSLSSCYKNSNVVRVGNMYGPSSVVASSLYSDDNYKFTTLTDPTGIVAKLDAGDLDIAIVPSNLAATLYNKEHNIKMISINNLCSIRVVSQNTSVKIPEDLKNTKIYSIGDNNVVGAILDVISNSEKYKFNLRNANIIYKTDVEEVLSNVSSDPKAIGIVTQPQASLTSRIDNNIYEIGNVKNEWNQTFGNDNNPVSAVTVVRTDFLEKHPDLVEKFLSDEKRSIEYANANPAEVAYIINKLSNKTTNMYDATDVLNCDVTYYDGQEMKRLTDKFFQMLYDCDPSYIGNILPDDDFYYINAQ